MYKIQLFYMIRNTDQSGVSGTGRVVEGGILPSGRVVAKWLSKATSIGLYNSMAKFRASHLDPHPGCNEVVIIDDEADRDDYLPMTVDRFYLERLPNPKFNSLTLGRVMDGLLFSDGTVVAEWCSPMDSFVYYKSMKDYKAVHVDPNPDTNKVYFQDFNIKED